MSQQQHLQVNDITNWNEVPGSNTYFRTSDVAPYIAENKLNIYNSRGIRRSWGISSVCSEITHLTDTVTMVNVVGWHKHTVSPVGGNFYFVYEGGQWVRRRANAKAVKTALAIAV